MERGRMFARCSDSVDGWQYRVPDSGAGAGYPGGFSEGEAAAGSRMKSNAAKESELDNPSFLHFKFHDFTHCVSDHLNIFVLHPDHSQALKRP